MKLWILFGSHVIDNYFHSNNSQIENIDFHSEKKFKHINNPFIVSKYVMRFETSSEFNSKAYR